MGLSAKIAKNTLIQAIGKLIATAIGLLAMAIMARYLNPEGFGEYTTAVTFLSFFAICADFGLTLITAKLISAPQADEKNIIGNLFGLRLTSALIFIGLAPIIISLFPYSGTIKQAVLIGALSFAFPLFNQVFVGLFQKKLCLHIVSLAEVVSRLILLVFTIAVVRLNLGLNGMMAAAVVSGLVGFLIHLIGAKKFIPLQPKFNLSLWKKIAKTSWPLAVTIIFNLIYLKADTLILSLFKSTEEVGLYGAAYKIVDVLTSLPFMFAGIILPLLSAAWASHNKDNFQHILQKSFNVMVIIALPLLVGTQFFAHDLIIFMAGSKFVSAGSILQILSLAVFFIFIGCLFAHAVIAIDRQKTIIWAYAFTSITSLALYLFLIPRYSYYGAAWGTVYSEGLIAAFSAYFVFRYSNFRPHWLIFFKSLLAAALMAALIYYFPSSWHQSIPKVLLSITIASIFYFLVLYLIKGISSTELKSLFGKKQNTETFSSHSS